MLVDQYVIPRTYEQVNFSNTECRLRVISTVASVGPKQLCSSTYVVDIIALSFWSRIAKTSTVRFTQPHCEKLIPNCENFNSLLVRRKNESSRTVRFTYRCECVFLVYLFGILFVCVRLSSWI